jgi:hypothetical protein
LGRTLRGGICNEGGLEGKSYFRVAMTFICCLQIQLPKDTELAASPPRWELVRFDTGAAGFLPIGLRSRHT